MKIAICDDEQACIDKLLTLIATYCTTRRLTCDCKTFTDPTVFGKSDLKSYDVVFLDANMGELDGIATAKMLREVNQTAILVYISGFVEYAPFGYRVDAFRYLMKQDLEDSFVDCMDEILSRLDKSRQLLCVITTNGEKNLVISSIVFVESFRHQILFHLSNGTTLESRKHSLTELTTLLMPHSFLRIHKSFLVNPEYISSIKNRVVTLDSGQGLNCGKTDYAEILRAYTLWKGGI